MEETTAQLEQKLKSIRDEIVGKISANSTVTAELKTQVENLQRQADAIDVRLAERHVAGTGTGQKTLVDLLREEEAFAR